MRPPPRPTPAPHETCRTRPRTARRGRLVDGPSASCGQRRQVSNDVVRPRLVPSATSQEPGRRRHMCMREHDKEAVVVIGAGLAGLTAAATAARAGKPVVVVEAQTAGGRAAPTSGAAIASTRGRTPFAGAAKPGGYCATWGCPIAVTDRRYVAPGLCATASWRGRQAARSARSSPGCSRRLALNGRAGAAEDWVESLGGSRELSDVARMLVRVTTYVTDLGDMPADFAISRIKGARRGVSYLDEGFASLVEGLSSAASAAGTSMRPTKPPSVSAPSRVDGRSHWLATRCCLLPQWWSPLAAQPRHAHCCPSIPAGPSSAPRSLPPAWTSGFVGLTLPW